MKNNKRGFIAISLVYSFFLVFLTVLISIIAEYAHNRILLGDVKKETINYLNSLSEFNPISLPSKNYSVLEEVSYAGDKWNVLSDNGNNVTLILKRSLTAEEIQNALNNAAITDARISNTTRMCLRFKLNNMCYFINYNLNAHNTYYWDSSVVKEVVNYWLNNNALLKKAISLNTMLKLNTFSDGRINYDNEYIRIPFANEYSKLNDSSTWYLTLYSIGTGPKYGASFINVGGIGVSAHAAFKTIRPVIVVQEI